MEVNKERKIYDLLRFYKDSRTEIVLTLNNETRLYGSVIDVSYFLNKTCVIKISDKSFMKIHLEDIKDDSIMPKEVYDKNGMKGGLIEK
jgi:hypothetical protein